MCLVLTLQNLSRVSRVKRETYKTHRSTRATVTSFQGKSEGEENSDCGGFGNDSWNPKPTSLFNEHLSLV